MAAVLIQADDFSGAAEVGQCFARQGLGTRILLDPARVGSYLPEAVRPGANSSGATFGRRQHLSRDFRRGCR